MRPSLLKYCKEGDAIPSVNCVRQFHLLKLFSLHFAALKAKLANQSVSFIANKTTDCHGHSIFNVIASIREESFHIDVVTLSESIHHVDIAFKDIVAFVTDSAAYYKKAHKEVLSNVFINSYHVLYLAHILNLVGEYFYTDQHLIMLPSSLLSSTQPFLKKLVKKYLKWL